MSDSSSPKPPAPIRARRWAGLRSSSRPRPYRLALRLIGIPAVAVAGVFIYSGLRDRLVLPECDSERAKKTLSEVLKELKLDPVRYEPIKTVSTTKEQVVCNAALPLRDGGTLITDYSFYWQAGKANMKYSVARHAPGE
jgi:hypothetical protein